jgi:hypothetical protein
MKFTSSHIICIIIITCFISACSKSETGPATKEFKFKTEPWEVNPYWGGPGEDSVWSSLSPDLPGFAVDIIAVKVKEKDGTVKKAWLQYDMASEGYQYQPGVYDYKLLFWWVQTRPLTRPAADSIFITFRTR